MNLDHYRGLPLEIRRMAERGEIDLPTLKKLVRAHRHESRSYDVPFGKCHEEIDTTIEIYDFGDDE